MKYLLLLLPLLLLSTASGQPPRYEKSYAFPGYNVSATSSIRLTSDGGVIVAGTLSEDDSTSSYRSTRGFLLRLNARGDTLWYKSYGTWYQSSLASVLQTPDGGFIACGTADDTYHGNRQRNNHWLLRTDANGDTLWTRISGGEENDALRGLLPLPDGYLVYGSFRGLSALQGYLARIDTAGNVRWSRIYNEMASFAGVARTDDGGYVLASGGDVMRVDSAGTVLWDTSFSRFSTCYNVIACSDGGFLIAGSNSNMVWLQLQKIDANGRTVWHRLYSQPGNNMANPMIVETHDNCYLVAGHEASGNYQPLIMKIDVGGKELWTRVYDSSISNHETSFKTLTITPENDIVAAGFGYYVYPRSGTTDVLVMRADSEGYLVHPPPDSFWNHLRYTGGGAMSSLVVDSAGTILAGEYSNTGRCLLYRSTDDGLTWHDNNAPGYQYGAMVAAPNGDLFAIRTMDWATEIIPEGTGGWRSTDHGETWQRLEAFPPTLGGTSLTMAVHTNGDLYALGYSGLYRSGNNGASWDSLPIPAAPLRTISVAPNGTLYVATNTSGVLRSTDRGETWSAIGPRADTGYVEHLETIAVRSNGDLFVTTGVNDGTYHSPDDGATWRRIDSAAGLNIVAMAFDRQGTIYASTSYYGNKPGTWRSSDNGATWTRLGDTAYNIRSLLFDPKGRLLGGGVGIFRTGAPAASVARESRNIAGTLSLRALPNPLTTQTLLRYSLPSRSHVSLAIVDKLGREVARLVEREEDQGEHSVEWSAEESPAGVYYCVLRAGTQLQVESIVVEH